MKCFLFLDLLSVFCTDKSLPEKLLTNEGKHDLPTNLILIHKIPLFRLPIDSEDTGYFMYQYT